jgi:hypothetical protein
MVVEPTNAERVGQLLAWVDGGPEPVVPVIRYTLTEQSGADMLNKLAKREAVVLTADRLRSIHADLAGVTA